MMPSVYKLTKTIYRTLVPQEVAKRHLWSGDSAISRILLRLRSTLEASARHDEVYDATYYRCQEEEMAVSSKLIAASIQRRFRPTSVLDVGCGSGAIMAALEDLGVDVVGLELSDAAIAMCKTKHLSVLKFDLEGVCNFEGQVDLALSTEVAEHLPENFANRFVGLLCSAAETVVVTAATPGQGGTDHVNEQPNEYWIAKFEHRGHRHVPTMTSALRTEWSNTGVDRPRAKNVMVFQKALS